MNPELLKRLKPLYGKLADALWLEYQLADPVRQRELDALVSLLAYRRLGIGLGDERILLEPPRQNIIGNGEYTIGNVIYPGLPAYPFRIKRNELLRHVLLLGPSGTGKSTLLLGLLEQLLADGTSCTVFDFKRNYRTLLHAPHSDRVLILTVGRDVAPLHLNALTPPEGVEFSQWAEALADICSAAYLLLQGARNVLKEALMRAYQADQASATLKNAHKLLELELRSARVGSRRYGWLESAVRTLQELSQTAFGQALNSTTNAGLHTLLDRPVVFELEGLGDDQKRFFCLFVLQSVLLLRKHGGAAREQLQHVLVFDESHHVFPKDQYGELSVPSRLAREVREYGEAIIAATQQADIADSLIANSGFKLFLRCDFPRDVDFASRLLHIDPKWMPKLPLGFGIARLPVRHYTPFLFHFAERPLKNEHVSDDEVRARWSSSGLDAPQQSEVSARPPPISERENALLIDILQFPITTITGRYQRLGWNAYTGNLVKDQLLNKGLAFFEPVSTPTGRVKILQLSATGEEAANATGLRKGYRRGSAEHEYWRHELMRALEQRGFTVQEEYLIGGGRTTDLCAMKDGLVTFWEIETGKSDVIGNIAKVKNLHGKVYFLFTSPVVRNQYAEQLGTHTALVPSDLPRLDLILGLHQP